MIEQIELAIMDRLREASAAGVLGYRYRTLATYPTDWDAYIQEVGGGLPAPAAWATFAGWSPKEGDDAAGFSVNLTFGVVVMAQNVRDEQATRHGGPNPATEPGTFRMAQDAAVLLHGQDFGLGIDSLSIGRLRVVQRLPAWGDRKVSMLALELLTGVRLQAAMPSDPPFADFRLFHANWDIRPFGNVDADPDQAGAQIPADATADATDEVQLETEAP